MLSSFLLLTACNKESTAQKEAGLEKATIIENKEKDTLVYDFKGKKVEVELKRMNIPEGFGTSIMLPEAGFEKIYEDKETGDSPFYIKGKDDYEGIKISIEKEALRQDSSLDSVKFQVQREMEIPVTGDYPEVTELFLEDYPELEANFDFFFRAEAPQLVQFVLGKMVFGELITISAAIMPEGDKDYEKLIIEILKTYIPDEKVMEENSRQAKEKSKVKTETVTYEFKGEQVKEKAKRITLAEQGVASMILPRDFDVQQYDSGSTTGTGKYEGIKINAYSNPVIEGQDTDSIKKSEEEHLSAYKDSAQIEEINLKKHPKLKERFDFAFKLEFTEGITQYFFTTIDHEQIYTFNIRFMDHVDKEYEKFLFEVLGTAKIKKGQL